MSIYLTAISSVGGLPLFTRSFSGLGVPIQVPFTSAAVLNGINLFAQANNAILHSASTDSHKVYWKLFDSILLIVIVSIQLDNDNQPKFKQSNLNDFLLLTYDLLILFCGLNELKEASFEKLKNSLKKCYSSLDYLLKIFVTGECLGLQIQCVEYQALDNQSINQCESILDSCSKKVLSVFGCLTIDGKIIAATKNYWSRILTTKDGLLISLLLKSLKSDESESFKSKNIFEIPIFLPHNCPSTLTRLIFSPLATKSTFITLCGENPPLDFIYDNVISNLKCERTNIDFFAKIENYSLINQLNFSLDDRLINALFLKNNLHVFFKYGIYCKEKINSLTNFLGIVKQKQLSNNYEISVTCLNTKLYCVYRKTGECLILTFSLKTTLNEMKTMAHKTITDILKSKKYMPITKNYN